MRYRALRFSGHAIRHMFGRDISTGEVIKEYSDDKPYPSFLMLAFVRGSPVHIVLAFDETTETAIVITAYLPDEQLWSDDFRTRRGE